MTFDQNNPNPKNVSTKHLKVMQNIRILIFWYGVIKDFKLNVLVKKRLGWKLENWKFEIYIFKQSLNLQVFGDLDPGVVFHLLSKFVGG